MDGDVLLWCEVPGPPKTKGSLEPRTRPCRCCPACRAVHLTGLRESVKDSKLWRQMMAHQFEARRSRGLSGQPYAGPVTVVMIYWLPVADVTSARAGDLDKLERNVLDALTDAGVYDDDVQVVKIQSEKYPATDVFGPGASVMVLAGRT